LALFETTFPPYHPFGSRNLSLGASGTDVAIVQAVYDLMLATMNPPQGPMGSPIPVTGHFDAATRAAVQSIQSYFGLNVDGVVGPNTFFVFGQGVGPHTTYGGPVYGSRELRQGDRGGDVTILQNRLNTFRYASIIGHPADGVFDAATAQAVLAFKADAAANGDTGFPDNPVAGSGFYDATWLYTFAGGRAIQTGRNGFDVVFLQVLLAQLGFYGGRFTGYYDAATRAAVVAFQAARHIAADGVVGPATFYQLGTGNQVPAPRPLAVAWPPSAPPAQVSVCSVALVTLTSDLHPYGEASHVVNETEGFESLDVVGNLLPDPSTFGSQYGQYAFTLTDPSTGQVIENVLMTPTPDATGDWAGSFSPGVKSIPHGVVTVYPTPAGSATGPYGPAVLAGDLARCH
jgi:peptidoglycan hydrolase-like protein with peptidoglycan-binding domain